MDCSKAIVCFETEDDRRAVEQAIVTPSHFKNYFTENGTSIKMMKAPEPQEIFWSKISLEESTRYKRKFVAWFLFILMLTVLTIAIYFLFSYTVHEVEVSSEQEAAEIIFLYLFGIIIFNKFLMAMVIHHLVDF